LDQQKLDYEKQKKTQEDELDIQKQIRLYSAQNTANLAAKQANDQYDAEFIDRIRKSDESEEGKQAKISAHFGVRPDIEGHYKPDVLELANGATLPVMVKTVDGKQQIYTRNKVPIDPPLGSILASDKKEINAANKPSGEEKNRTVEQLTAESLEVGPDGKPTSKALEAKRILDTMQKRQLQIAFASKQTPTKTEEDKAIEETARSLASGDLTALRDVTSMMGGARLRVYARAKELNPNFSTSDIQRKINMENLYTTGKVGENLSSFGMFLEHAGEAHDVLGNIQLSGTPAFNKPLNWWRKNMSGDPNYQALMVALEAPRKEYESFLLGGRALYEDDRKAVELLLSDDASPKQILWALKQMAKTSKERVNELNYRYKRLMGKDFEKPFSEEAIGAASKLGVDLNATGGEDPDVKAYADAHFGGDVAKAKAAIAAQQGKK
jgi:hypothetical protein